MWGAVQSIGIGLLAPAGIWFGWYLQGRDKAADRSHAHNALLREKAERIYLEIEAAYARSAAYVFKCLNDLHGNVADGEGVGLVPNIDTLAALLRMYFPGADNLVHAHHIAAAVPIQKHSDTFKKVQADEAIDVGEKLQRIKQSNVDTARALNMLTIETLAKVRAYMNNEVTKLL